MTDDELPPDLPDDAVPHERPVRKQPLASPYAIPLGTLTAGAYVGVTDQVQVQPVDGPMPAGSVGGFTGPADDGDA